MENILDARKVNRGLFAQRVVDIHNDEFGFAQDGVIYTYATDVKAKTKGVPWLRMQKTGEEGPDRRKYFLFFADETEASAYVDKHNDIYDMEGNYVASLVRSKFIIFLVLFVAAVIFFTGLAIYLGGSMIMDTTSPFSEDKTIHLEASDSTRGKGSSEEDIDLFGQENIEKDNSGNNVTPKNPIQDVENKIKDDIKKNDPLPIAPNKAKEEAKNRIRDAAEEAKKAIDEDPVLTPEQKEMLKADVDKDADDAIKNIDGAKNAEEVQKALDDGLKEIVNDLDEAAAWAFIDKYCSNGDGDPYDKRNDPITDSNAKQVVDGEHDFDKLTNKQREIVNKLIITPTDDEAAIGYDKHDDTFTGYAEMLREAKAKLPKAIGSLSSGSIEGTTRNLYPGAADMYYFYVQNDGTVPLKYQLSLSEENAKSIPLRFKVLVDDEYVSGNETTWVNSANYVSTNIVIGPGQQVQYKILWEWPDENTPEANARDTQFGIEAQTVAATYLIHATVYFEEVV